MKLQRMQHYTAPGYPTRVAVDAEPEILRTFPRRWQVNAAVLAVLTGAGLLATPHTASSAGTPATAPVVARVAPLFPSPGLLDRSCITGKIAMPKFLSEDEARLIIVEEASKAGIQFAAEKLTLQDLRMPTEITAKDGTKTPGMLPVTETLDGTDGQRHISYEFVSTADEQAWQKAGVVFPAGEMSAQVFHDSLTQSMPAGTVAVFYDPASKLATGEDLRQQVRDFITWLKVEGVI